MAHSDTVLSGISVSSEPALSSPFEFQEFLFIPLGYNLICVLKHNLCLFGKQSGKSVMAQAYNVIVCAC